MRILSVLFLALSTTCFAQYSLGEDLREDSREDRAFTASVEENYSALINAYERGQWRRVQDLALFVMSNFSSSPFVRDASFYLGVAYFKQGQYELANEQLTVYLARSVSPKFFGEAIQYKFDIAEGFRTGVRKHFLGLQGLPKWASAGSNALPIYDEVISARPHSELATCSLYGKAEVLRENEDFRASIECYQTLIRRFPKNPLAIESYIGIGYVYYLQSQSEYPDPDYLDLAQLNLRKFAKSFPGEEKLEVAHANFARMQEHYASCFFETAKFYERTKKWGAAKIYYKKILATYPKSEIAKKSQKRLENVEAKIERFEAKKARR